MNIEEKYNKINTEIQLLSENKARLVAVSKTKPPEILQEAYEAGIRVFGENKVQEMVEKFEVLPKDIEWHFIGHLQRNKVKYIAPFVSLIHAVDSLKLLQEIDKQALRNNRTIDCLLQIYIAQEHTKFGLAEIEVLELLQSESCQNLKNIRLRGLMGMATNTDNLVQIRQEFRALKNLFEKIKTKFTYLDNLYFSEISMGMSGDYQIALEEGSTLVRVGSKLFGSRI